MSQGQADYSLTFGLNPDDVVQVLLLSFIFLAIVLFALFKIKSLLFGNGSNNVPQKQNINVSTNTRRKAD